MNTVPATLSWRKKLKTFTLTIPHRVAISHLKAVEQFKRMDEMGVIKKVKEPTELCIRIVVFPRANSKVSVYQSY